MNEENDVIAALDDAAARRVLATVARARLHGGATPLERTPDLGRALAEALDVAPSHEPASEGDVARLALRLLPRTRSCARRSSRWPLHRHPSATTPRPPSSLRRPSCWSSRP